MLESLVAVRQLWPFTTSVKAFAQIGSWVTLPHIYRRILLGICSPFWGSECVSSWLTWPWPPCLRDTTKEGSPLWPPHWPTARKHNGLLAQNAALACCTYFLRGVRHTCRNMDISPYWKQASHSSLVIKLIEPKIEETPDKWRLKMAKSTDPPEWLVIPLNGG